MARYCAIDPGGVQLLDGQNPRRLLGSTQRKWFVILRHLCRLSLVSLLALSCRAAGSMLPLDLASVSSWESLRLMLLVSCMLEVRVCHPDTMVSAHSHSIRRCRAEKPMQESVNLTGLIVKTSLSLKRGHLHELYGSCGSDSISEIAGAV
jgi:hypothetical protein